MSPNPAERLPRSQIRVLKRKKLFASSTVFYPQIIGHPSRVIQSRINGLLRREFFEAEEEPDESLQSEDSEGIYDLMNSGAIGEAEVSDEATVVETEQRVGFRTGLINDTVLSLQYQWWASGGAHPIYTFKGFTIELATGYVFHFDDLFKSDSLFIPVINELVLRSLQEQGRGFIDFTRKRAYDFYLTKKNLVLFNLFDYEAARGVEALIKPKDISYLLDQGSPLASIL